MKRYRVILPLVLLTLIAIFWWRRQRPINTTPAYLSDRSATLWSSLAQVRHPVAILHYGEKVQVLLRRGEQAEVRTAAGTRGWMAARPLMEPAFWQRSQELLAQARSMPIQARGHTKVLSNLHAEPNRSAARFYQLNRGAPVEVLARGVAEWSPPAGEKESAALAKEAEEGEKPRREDWFLVRGFASSAPSATALEGPTSKGEDTIEVAGWALGRFIGLDLPAPVRDYATFSGIRVLASFELNRVPDDGGEQPQYLAAGVRGSEGQECDFTLIRVYTWGARRKRYETAYVESNFCGRLPIRVSKTPSGDPEFRFRALAKNGDVERTYRLLQTVVRRVREGEPRGAKSAPRPR